MRVRNTKCAPTLHLNSNFKLRHHPALQVSGGEVRVVDGKQNNGHLPLFPQFPETSVWIGRKSIDSKRNGGLGGIIRGKPSKKTRRKQEEDGRT